MQNGLIYKQGCFFFSLLSKRDSSLLAGKHYEVSKTRAGIDIKPTHS